MAEGEAAAVTGVVATVVVVATLRVDMEVATVVETTAMVICHEKTFLQSCRPDLTQTMLCSLELARDLKLSVIPISGCTAWLACLIFTHILSLR